MFQALVKRGVLERVLILECKAINSGQNVAFAREQVKDLGISELLLIGKISSKRRYVMTVRKQWPEIRRICCYGVNYFSCAEEYWWKDREFRNRVISECRRFDSRWRRHVKQRPDTRRVAYPKAGHSISQVHVNRYLHPAYKYILRLFELWKRYAKRQATNFDQGYCSEERYF